MDRHGATPTRRYPAGMRRSRSHRTAALVAILSIVAWTVVATTALAASPPFPEPIPGQHVYDTAGTLSAATRSNLESMATSLAEAAGVDVAVYTQTTDAGPATQQDATAAAAALVDQWGLDLAVLAEVGPDGTPAALGIASGPGTSRSVDAATIDAVRAEVASWLSSGDVDSAMAVAMSRLLVKVMAAGDAITGVPAPGPPFPDPVDKQAVYDFAGILSPEAIHDAEATIDAIEARTGAEVAVYTQDVDYGVTTEETQARALELIRQWGIGRKGFDDGMVIFFDIDPSRKHGQVQLYAAPGFEAAYLTNSQRQAIYENDMLPLLRNGDFDGALRVAMQRIDAAATPENAASLQRGRQIDAVLGLVGAPIVFLGLSGWAFWNWRRFGKDPVYLDDPSILMPAPPPDLTAASGAFVMDGKTSRRALTTAMLDLASRGLISFREEREGLLGMSHKVGIDTDPPKGDATEEARRALNARRPVGPAETIALSGLHAIHVRSYIKPKEMPEFATTVPRFDSALEGHVVERGWMVEQPSKVIGRWVGRGALAVGAGVIALVIGINVPIAGLVMIGGAAIAGGIVIMLFAQGMPSVTMAGAMVRAMLAAYRRTLEKTMEQARSMQQVVDEAGFDWLVTPDQAVVWGTALGLQGRIDEVLQRSLQDVQAGRVPVTSTYFPAWYTTSSGSSFASAAASGSGGSIFSGSAVPDLGGMMSAPGTIGNAPSSAAGGGGFGGGGGGGGGGGAGGGF